jgi:hypothetical protein
MAEQKENPEPQDKKKLKELRDLNRGKMPKGARVTTDTPTSDLLLVKSIS